MLRRLFAILFLAWALAFVWFAVSLPQPMGSEKTDAVVVLTGGEGRIKRGIEVVQNGWAPRMLVSGVDREVKPREFQVQYRVPPELMRCCITLGFESVDTRTNASETSRWLAETNARSVRLVTTDWHMRRASWEMTRLLPADIAVRYDAVPSHPSLQTLFIEYHKLLARVLAQVWGE